MKKIIMLLSLCYALPLWAFTLHPTHELFVGIPVYGYQYREPSYMKDRGYFYGLEASIAHYEPFMAKLGLTLTRGHVDYTSKSTGSEHNNHDRRVEISSLIGLPITSNEQTRMIPYLGFAYRFFQDDSSGRISTSGAWGYNRESNYLYLPLGLEFWKTLNAHWQTRLTAEVDPLWHGFQESDLSTLDGTNKQDSGYGVKLSIKLIHGKNGRHYFIEPFFHYWNIDRSELSIDDVSFNPDLVMTGAEPHNITREVGVVIGLLL